MIAGRQTVTRAWWSTAPSGYRLLASQLVLEECGGGEPDAAAERLDALRVVELLDASMDVDRLASALTDAGAVPASEPRDAYHIAIAAVNGVKYLVTWNFKHIANAVMRDRIEMVCRAAGFEPPIICTPDELLSSVSLAYVRSDRAGDYYLVTHSFPLGKPNESTTEAAVCFTGIDLTVFEDDVQRVSILPPKSTNLVSKRR